MRDPIPDEGGPVQRPRGWQYLAGVLVILALAALACWLKTRHGG